MIQEAQEKTRVFRSNGHGGYYVTSFGRIFLGVVATIAPTLVGGAFVIAFNFWHEINLAIDGYARLSTEVDQERKARQDFEHNMRTAVADMRIDLNRLQVIVEERTEISENESSGHSENRDKSRILSVAR